MRGSVKLPSILHEGRETLAAGTKRTPSPYFGDARKAKINNKRKRKEHKEEDSSEGDFTQVVGMTEKQKTKKDS